MSETRAVQRKAAQLPEPVVGLMQQLVPDCNALLPADITVDQFRAALWLELTGRPSLHGCTPQSLRECVVKAATFGLLPGRDVHFLPFNDKGRGKVATYVPNYQGLILALERTGKVRRAFAHPVHEGDVWEYDYFSDRPIHHPAVTIGKKQGPELFYYGAIQFRDGTFAVEIVTLEELDKIRRVAPSHENGPWVQWPVMMKRKTALKQAMKYIRLTPQVEQLVAEDDVRQLTDIAPERHRQNVVDLFGETDALQGGLQDERHDAVNVVTGEVVEAVQPPISTPGSPQAGLQNSEAAGGLPGGEETKEDIRPEWRTILQAHIDQLPSGKLRADCRLALNDPQCDAARGEALAHAVVDALAALEEQAAQMDKAVEASEDEA